MKPIISSLNHSGTSACLTSKNRITCSISSNPHPMICLCPSPIRDPPNTCPLFPICCIHHAKRINAILCENRIEPALNMYMDNAILPPIQASSRPCLGGQALFVISIISCASFVAFVSLVIIAIPTLQAMRKAAISLSKFVDVACEEMPCTMAAIRLSSLEIKDLTLELSDWSKEVAHGIHKSAQALQAAADGARWVGALARKHTVSFIQEKAKFPNVSLQPAVARAAQSACNAVAHATRSIKDLFVEDKFSSPIEHDLVIDAPNM